MSGGAELRAVRVVDRGVWYATGTIVDVIETPYASVYALAEDPGGRYEVYSCRESGAGRDRLLYVRALLEQHPTGTIYVAWDNASTHEDDEVDDVVRAAAGRLVLLYLPTHSPRLNPIEMLWRHFRREVTHCELFATMTSLLAAAAEFFARHNRAPHKTLPIIESNAAKAV